MSRDDAPNFRHIPTSITCAFCKYMDQWGYCHKYEFIVSRVDFYLCDTLEE